MSTLLFVNSSLNGGNSKSRELAVELIAKAYPTAQIVTRELTVENSPHLAPETLGALMKPALERSSDEQKRVAYANEAAGHRGAHRLRSW